ncbi:MAG: DsbC family protein [Gammaproteobacteria bacterium]|nr:DsbC family protein [Gammaproteobacteria bacterium]
MSSKLLSSLFAFATAILILSGAARAQDDPRSAIAGKLPGVTVEDVQESPVAGLYEVAVGANVVYLSKGGRYLLQGEMVDLEGNANLTEARRGQLRQRVLNEMGVDKMIVFSPENVKHSITVFTDIDCAYCRKLHREMVDLNNRGIEVRYMFWPRSGPNTESWAKAEKVWCSADRNSAMTLAKAGKPVEAEVCEGTPVNEHYKLGRDVGLRGTPAIVTEKGRLISGYLPAPQLAAELDKDNKS